jgi:hypothetical protein
LKDDAAAAMLRCSKGGAAVAAAQRERVRRWLDASA